MYNIPEILERIDVITALRHCGKGEYRSGGGQKNPWNPDDRHPSFSIFGGGKKFKDHGDDDYRGNAIDVFRFTYGVSPGEAIKIAAGFAGVGPEPPSYREIPPPYVRKCPAPVKEYKHEDFGEGAPVNVSAFARKGIDLSCVSDEWVREGTAGWWKGKLCWTYEDRAAKCRTDISTSRGDRWVYGAGDAGLWRWDHGEYRHIIIVEGETDTARLLTEYPEKPGWRYVGQPGASWKFAEDYIYSLAHGRNVYVLMDDDHDGSKTSRRLFEEASSVGAKGVKQVTVKDFADVDGDLCDLPNGIIKEKFDEVFRMD